MAGILPLVRSTATALYPVQRSVEFDTAVNIMNDGTEQRWRRRQALSRVSLQYNNLAAADRDNLLAFFATQKGLFDSTWFMVLGKAAVGSVSGTALTVPSTTQFFTANDVGKTAYVAGASFAGVPTARISAFVNSTHVTLATAAGSPVSNADTRWGYYLGNMALGADIFTGTENGPKLYTVAIQARQTANRGYALPTIGGSYPNLSAGVVAQLPFSQLSRFYTLISDQESGPRYSYEYYDAGLTGFPAGALLGWTLQYNALGDADLDTVENFFRGNAGRYGTFSFTDPETATTYTDVRFDHDVLTVEHAGFNLASTTVRLIQTNT